MVERAGFEPARPRSGYPWFREGLPAAIKTTGAFNHSATASIRPILAAPPTATQMTAGDFHTHLKGEGEHGQASLYGKD